MTDFRYRIGVRALHVLIFIFVAVGAQAYFLSKPAPAPLTIALQQVQKKYNKKYRNEEQRTYRKLILESNKKTINEHNKKSGRSYTQGQNQYIDLSPEEFLRTYTGLMASTPGMRQFVRDYSELKVYEEENCNCLPGYDLKKMELQKKVVKNSGEYGKGIERHLAKLAETDAKLKYPPKQAAVAKTAPPNNLSTIISSLLSGGLTKLSLSPILSGAQQAMAVGSGSTTTTTTTSTKSTTTTSSFSASSTTSTTSSTTPMLSNFTDIDWTNMSGPIRYQGACGSCYALTAVQVLEAANAIYSFGGTYILLSVQQILDCAVPNYNGCEGGLIEWSYGLMQLTGIVSAFRYPYTSGTTGVDGPCKAATGGYKILSFRQLGGTCTELRAQLQYKPVSTAIKARNMIFYSSGVFDNCPETDPLDHAVVIIGFESTTGWKFKNTWGITWGIDGYGWLTLDENKNCGICMMPVVPKTYNQPA